MIQIQVQIVLFNMDTHLVYSVFFSAGMHIIYSKYSVLVIGSRTFIVCVLL